MIEWKSQRHIELEVKVHELGYIWILFEDFLIG